MWEIITTVSIFGLTECGLLIWVISDMRATQREHTRRLDVHRGRIEVLERLQFGKKFKHAEEGEG